MRSIVIQGVKRQMLVQSKAEGKLEEIPDLFPIPDWIKEIDDEDEDEDE